MLTSVDEQHENGQKTKNDPHFLLFGNLVTVSFRLPTAV
jgi:hypothetical protein